MKRILPVLAAGVLLSVSVVHGQTATELLTRGMQKVQQNDVDGAIADFTKAIELQENNLDAYRERALAKARKRDFDGALADLNRCISIKPDDARSIYERGRVRRARNDLDGAIADFNVVMELAGETPLFLNQRGLVKHDKGNFDGAIADYNKAIDLRPPNDLAAQVFANRGKASLAKKDADAAIADADRAVQLNTRLLDGYAVRSKAKLEKGDTAGALADANKLVELDANNPRVYTNRGHLAWEMGKLDQAAADFDQAVKLAPTEGELRDSRAYFRYDQRLWVEALADFQMAVKVAPAPHDDYIRFRIWLIQTSMSTAAQKDAATKELKDYMAARKAPKKPDDWPGRIGAYLAGSMSEADFLKSAASNDKKTELAQHCEAYFYVGAVALNNGNNAAAVAAFEKSVATGVKEYTEYRSAKAELARLKK